MRAFLEAHAALILRLARAYVGSSRDDAADVAQEVAATLLRMNERGAFDPHAVEVPEAYLRVVVRHAAIRARKRRGQLADEADAARVVDEHLSLGDDAPPTPEDLTREAIDTRRWLDAVKARLRPRDAAAFAFLVEDALPIEDTARALGTTPNNVYQMRHRILVVAREMLEARGDQPVLTREGRPA